MGMKSEMKSSADSILREAQPSAAFRTQSLDSFVALKEEILREVGVPEGFELLRGLQNINHDLRSSQVIDKELTKRSQSHKVTDKLRNMLRKVSPMPKDPRSIMFSASEDVKHIKTEDLEKLKGAVAGELKRIEQFSTPLANLTETELDPEVRALLATHGKQKVHELLEPGVEVGWNDLLQLVTHIAHSFDFRNRKIAEFVGYKYARSAPVDMNIETFILNAHQILDWHKSKSTYRKVGLKNGSGFNAPVASVLLPDMMKKFSQDVDEVGHLEDNHDVLKEAIKKYMMFEIIHPFQDGNGRTGRALFVYLQKRFKEKASIADKPVHIPIARYESGTVFSEERRGFRNYPGSLSLEVNMLVHELMQNKEILALSEELQSSQDMDVDTFYNGVSKVLNSEEVSTELDKLVDTIKKQSALDDMSGQDWSMVYDSARDNLLKQRFEKAS